MGPFTMIFFIVVFILMLQFLWLYIDELVGKGLGLMVILEFLFWGTGTILPLALPLATLIASLMTLGNMGESNELLAMKAAGISLQRILNPLIVVSIIISVIAFFVSNNFIPISYNKIYTLQYDIGKTKSEIKIPTGTFYNGIDGFTLRVDNNNKETGMMYGVMVYDHSDNRGNIRLAVADSGTLKSTPDKKSLVFTLYNGVSYEEDNVRKHQDTSYSVQTIDFEMQEVLIELDNYSFEKSEEGKFGNEIMAKGLSDLQKDKDSLGRLFADMSTRQLRKIIYSSGFTYSEQLDTAKNKAYSKTIILDSIPKPITNQERLMAYTKLQQNLGVLTTSLESMNLESNQYTFSLRRIELESFRKFALSIACLIFFFIGAPLGAIIRKGGLGTPVIVSSIFFVLYWVVDISGKKLARDGSMSPLIGAFISSLVLLPIGVFLTWKSTKDSSLFNVENYIKPIKNLFNKIKSFNVRKEK